MMYSTLHLDTHKAENNRSCCAVFLAIPYFKTKITGNSGTPGNHESTIQHMLVLLGTVTLLKPPSLIPTIPYGTHVVRPALNYVHFGDIKSILAFHGCLLHQLHVRTCEFLASHDPQAVNVDS